MKGDRRQAHPGRRRRRLRLRIATSRRPATSCARSSSPAELEPTATYGAGVVEAAEAARRGRGVRRRPARRRLPRGAAGGGLRRAVSGWFGVLLAVALAVGAHVPDAADRRDLRPAAARRAGRRAGGGGSARRALAVAAHDGGGARADPRRRHAGRVPARDAPLPRPGGADHADRAAARAAAGGRRDRAARRRRAVDGARPGRADAGLQLTLATAGVVVALTFVAAPFYLRQAIAAFEAVDPTLLDASRTLGASPARTFARVAIPTALPGLVAGTALALGRALGEFGATLMFAGSFQGDHADRPARDLRPLRDRLHRGARAVGGARRGLGGDPAVGQARARARTRSRDERARRVERAHARSARSSSTSRSTVARGRVPRARRAVGRGQDERAARRRRAARAGRAAASRAAARSGSTRSAASPCRPSGGAAATCSRSTRCSAT